MNCPYCGGRMSAPPPKDAGKLLGCPYCKQYFRFTGVGALAVPQPAPQLPPEPAPSLGVPAQAPEVRSTFDVFSGMKLFCLCMVAAVAEVIIYFILAMSVGGQAELVKSLAQFFGMLFLVTVAAGFGAPFLGMANMIRQKR